MIGSRNTVTDDFVIESHFTAQLNADFESGIVYALGATRAWVVCEINGKTHKAPITLEQLDAQIRWLNVLRDELAKAVDGRAVYIELEDDND